jgi:hypothetical protein
MSDPQSAAQLEELEAIAAELEALGEPLPEDMAQELAQARALAQVQEAVQRGAQAVESLPEALPAQSDALEGLHRLRAASGQDQLSAPRADALWGELANKLPQPERAGGGQVISMARWVRWGSAVAAVAAVLLVALLWTQQGDPTLDNVGAEVASQEVPQVELERAQARLSQVEAESLKALMAQASPLGSRPGDHGLRRLRQARTEAARARFQARARRL